MNYLFANKIVSANFSKLKVTFKNVDGSIVTKEFKDEAECSHFEQYFSMAYNISGLDLIEIDN